MHSPRSQLATFALLLFVEIAIWVVWTATRDAPQRNDWLILALLEMIPPLLAVYYWEGLKKIFRGQRPGCSLFFFQDVEWMPDGNGGVRQKIIPNAVCNKPAVGIAKKHDGTADPFCQDHDPETGWMKRWLEKRGILIKEIEWFPEEDIDDADDDIDDEEDSNPPLF